MKIVEGRELYDATRGGVFAGTRVECFAGGFDFDEEAVLR